MHGVFASRYQMHRWYRWVPLWVQTGIAFDARDNVVLVIRLVPGKGHRRLFIVERIGRPDLAVEVEVGRGQPRLVGHVQLPRTAMDPGALRYATWDAFERGRSEGRRERSKLLARVFGRGEAAEPGETATT